MDESSPRRVVTTRVLRRGDPQPTDRDWEGTTPEERIEAVWQLTLLCLAWGEDRAGEPRLQRSVSRVQRRRG